MPLALGNYIPNGKFRFPRSYIRGIGFSLSGYTITPTATGYMWVKNIDPSEHWYIDIDPRIYAWSSNVYSLDYVITRFQLQFLPFGVATDQPFTVQWWTRGANASQYLMFFYSYVTFPDFTFFDWPAAPPGYWRPPWWNG